MSISAFRLWRQIKKSTALRIFFLNADVVSGVLEQMIFEVPFSSLPTDMIDTVTIDLEGLPAGTVLTINDIPEFRSEQIELKIAKDSLVLRINDKNRAITSNAE